MNVLTANFVGVGLSNRAWRRSGDQTKIMLGVLEIVLRCNGIAARMGVPRQLQIFFGDVPRGPAYFDVRSMRFISAGQWVGFATGARRPTP